MSFAAATGAPYSALYAFGEALYAFGEALYAFGEPALNPEVH